MSIKPGPKPKAESTGKTDQRRSVTPENKSKHPSLNSFALQTLSSWSLTTHDYYINITFYLKKKRPLNESVAFY